MVGCGTTFGIPFGSKELCLHIELSDDDARPSQYRERLISKQSGADILPSDYAFAVHERMPDWVKDVIRNASPRQSEDYNDIRKELQELLSKYRVRVTGRKIRLGAWQTFRRKEKGQDGFGGSGANSSGRSLGSRRRFHEVPEGAVTTSLYEIFERGSTYHHARNSRIGLEKGLKGRAAQLSFGDWRSICEWTI